MAENVPPKVAAWHLHRRLYNWVIHFADTPHGERALFLLSFAESSFFPIPPDVLLAPLTLGAPDAPSFRLASMLPFPRRNLLCRLLTLV